MCDGRAGGRGQRPRQSLVRSFVQFAHSSLMVDGLLLSDGLGALSVSQDEGIAPDVCAAPHLLADLLRFDYRVVRKLRHPIFD